jgi:hypothetical protein
LIDNEEDSINDEYTQNADEYDDIVTDTLNDDPANSLFKNILKKEGNNGGFGASFGGRDSVLSGRNSYNRSGRFSSKYGDNRLYLQRLSRNSIDSS